MALNPNAQLFMQGLQGASEAAGRHQEATRPLSPVERYQAEVLSGRLEPREAAIRLKLEMAQGSQNQGLAPQWGQPAQAPMLNIESTHAPEPGAEGPTGTVSRQERSPFATGADLATARQGAGQTGQFMQVQAANDRKEMELESKKDMARMQLERQVIHDAAVMEQVLAKLQSAWRIASGRNATDRDIAVFEAQLREAQGYQKNHTQLLGTIANLAGNPRVLQEQNELARAAAEAVSRYGHDLNVLRNSTGLTNPNARQPTNTRTSAGGKGPANKPKTIKQNGVTYTLNPQTGQYE